MTSINSIKSMNKGETMKEGKIVYHYCSVDVFYKIIIGKSLKLSDILKANDSMEIKYCQGEMKVLFYRIGYKISHSELINPYIKSFFKNFDSELYFENLIERFQVTFFASCFSKSRDLLSQWRGYGANGSGFAIGFNTSIFNFEHDRLIFNDISYDSEQMMSQLETEIMNKLENIETEYEGEALMHDACMNIIHIFTKKFFFHSVFLKHPAFSEENESRLVYFPKTSFHSLLLRKQYTLDLMDNPYFDLILEHQNSEWINGFFRSKIKFEPNKDKDNIVPFLFLYYGDLISKYPISEVIIGPKNKCALRDIQTLMLLNGFDITNIKFIKSDAPYK